MERARQSDPIVNCPHCGRGQRVTPTVFAKVAVTYCDSEIGGCDRRFLYEAVPITYFDVLASTNITDFD